LPSSLASCAKVNSGLCSLRTGRKSEEKKINAVFAFFGAFLSFFLPFLPLVFPSPFVFFDAFVCLAGAFLFVVFFFLCIRFGALALHLITTSWFSGRHNIIILLLNSL